MEDDELFSAPVAGPFELRKGFAYRALRDVVIVAVLLVAATIGTVAMGWITWHDAADIVRIWENGVEAEEAGITGTRKQTEYDLDVTFTLPNGEKRSFHAEFERFLLRPDEKGPFAVRYLPDDPSQAVLSWQVDAVPDKRAHSYLMFALAVAFLVGAPLILRPSLRYVARMKRLAQEGQLQFVRVNDLSVDARKHRTVVWTQGNGAVQRQWFAAAHPVPYLVNDGEELLVLALPNGDDSVAIRLDGEPLVWPPPQLGTETL